MITLATTNTIQAKAGTASAISCTITGMELSGGVESYKVLAQGQLSGTTSILYTVPASTVSFVREILLNNTTGSSVSLVTFFINGSSASNQICSFSIPANGTAVFGNEGWSIYDTNGSLITGSVISLAGDVTGLTSANTVTKINGTSLAGLTTGILKNTTTTGVPSIAIAADFPTLNQNTTGSSASVSGTNVITNSNLSQVAAHTYKGNNTGSTANVIDVTNTQLTADLNLSTTTLQGLMSAQDRLDLNAINGRNSSLAAPRVFRPGDFMVGNTYDPTGSSDSTTSFTAMMTAVNAFADRCIIELPAGVFKVNTGVFTGFASGAPITIKGQGRGTTVLIPASSTGDMIKLTSGMDGVQIQDFAIYQTGTPQTSGAGINTNGANSITIENMLFVNLFNDVFINGSSIKVSIQKTLHSQTNGSSTSVGVLVSNGSAGDTYIGPDVVMSNTGATRRRASVEITQSGHYEINQANLTGAAQGILIDPPAGQIVAFGFHNEVLCDSCTVNGMTMNATTATSTIKNIKSTTSWYSGTIAGTGGAGVLTTGTAGGIIDGITFSNDRFLNNQTHGFQHGFGTDFRWEGCDMKGNSAAGSNANDGLNIAAGVSNWSVLGGKYGGTDSAPTGGNQRWGINIASGVNTNTSIVDIDLTGNNSGPLQNLSSSIIDVNGCLGLPIVPGATAPATLLTGAGTEVYVTPSFPFPLGSLQIGNAYVCKMIVTNTATINTATIRLKFGTAGTTADGNIISQALGAGTAVIGIAEIECTFIVKALGSGTASILGILKVLNGNSGTNVTGFTNVPIQTFQATVATFNSTVANFMGVGISPSVANVVTVQSVVWQELSK
jgi:hypothetical protein